MFKKSAKQTGASRRSVMISTLGVCALLAGTSGCSTTKSNATLSNTRATPPTGMLAVAGETEPGHAGALTARESAERTNFPRTGTPNPWIAFRSLWFFYNRAELDPSEIRKVSEVARYLEQNPSAEVGIDSSIDLLGAKPGNEAVNTGRISAIRDALIAAGVPASRIQVGTFAALALDRRVLVLVRTSNSQL